MGIRAGRVVARTAGGRWGRERGQTRPGATGAAPARRTEIDAAVVARPPEELLMGMHGGGPPPMWMWGGGRRRQPTDTGPGNSGITGDPGREEPAAPEGPKDLRGRWLNFKQSFTGTLAALPQVTRLVWEASPGTTLGLFAATVLAGLTPAASAYISKLLVEAVVAGIKINATHAADRLPAYHLGPLATPSFTAFQAVVFLALLQLAVFAFSSLLGTIRNICQQLLQNSVTMSIQLVAMA